MNYMQCGGGCAVWIGNIISTVDIEDVQYGSVTRSMRVRVCSAGLQKLLGGLMVVVASLGE